MVYVVGRVTFIMYTPLDYVYNRYVLSRIFLDTEMSCVYLALGSPCQCGYCRHAHTQGHECSHWLSVSNSFVDLKSPLFYVLLPFRYLGMQYLLLPSSRQDCNDSLIWTAQAI